MNEPLTSNPNLLNDLKDSHGLCHSRLCRAVKAQAVVEIERLTAERDTLISGFQAEGKLLRFNLNETRAERDRLTAELQGTKDELYSVDKAAKELGAERDRYRAALERIANDTLLCGRCVDIAREALAGEDRPKDRPQAIPCDSTQDNRVRPADETDCTREGHAWTDHPYCIVCGAKYEYK